VEQTVGKIMDAFLLNKGGREKDGMVVLKKRM
jgi:hypothetical protein